MIKVLVWGYSPVVELLVNMLKALGSISITAKCPSSVHLQGTGAEEGLGCAWRTDWWKTLKGRKISLSRVTLKKFLTP